MTSIKPGNKLNIRSMYQDVQPDPWAVTRMKARLNSEKRISLSLEDLVARIFKRYVLAVSVVLLVLTIVLDSRITPVDDAQDEIAAWLYGEASSFELPSDFPEYTFLTEIQDIP